VGKKWKVRKIFQGNTLMGILHSNTILLFQNEVPIEHIISSSHADEITASCKAVVKDCVKLVRNIPEAKIIDSNCQAICCYCDTLADVYQVVDKYSRLTCNHYAKVKVTPPVCNKVNGVRVQNPKGFGVRGKIWKFTCVCN